VTLPLTVAAGSTATITVGFTPTAVGARSGALSIAHNATGSPASVTLAGTGSGTVAPMLRLSTLGNQIVDSTGANVRLKSINWFGGEGPNFCPNGIWLRGYKSVLDQIKGLGFNCVRLPLADDILTATPLAIDYSSNADLVGLSAIAVLDAIIAYGGSIGLWFVLDQHRHSATTGSGTDGWPPASGDGGYTVTQWAAFWVALATRYAAQPAVCGYDPHNEPYHATWDTWATMVEQLDLLVRPHAPDWLCFVEGVGTYSGVSYWWGGQLAGVASRPVTLSVAHKVVYSPHEYGLSTGAQSWLASSSNTVTGWPGSLKAEWLSAWSYIFTTGIAPIWIGEFGGKFGYNGSGVLDTSSTDNVNFQNGPFERQWLNTLVQYLDGDTNLAGGGATTLTGTQKGISFAYWSLNPNSGDTGGLLEDDWITVQAGKLALLAPLLT